MYHRQKFKRVQISKDVILKSGLEEVVFNFLKDNKCSFKYEGMKITYFQPAIKKTYKPDFPITGSFIVQNSLEAQYWVAVMHYLRSITKMYYGQSEPQGAPPPIVKLNGYGDYVFNNVPVIVTNFTIDMPQDVDYIATELGTQNGTQSFATDFEPRGSSVSYAPSESPITIQVQPIYSRAQTERFSLNSFISGDYVSNGSGYI